MEASLLEVYWFYYFVLLRDCVHLPNNFSRDLHPPNGNKIRVWSQKINEEVKINEK